MTLLIHRRIMRKLSFGKCFVVASLLVSGLCSCGKSSTEEATDLLDNARAAMLASDYNKARELIDSLRATYPREFDVRRAAILVADSVELAEAKDSLQVADSLETFRSFQLEDTKTLFVLEKQEKYQTVGYYVVPAHAGNKSKLSFFPEVDETGKFLLVDIDANRKYTFTEVDLNEYDSESLEDLYKKTPEGQKDALKQCERLATDFLMLKQAREMKEKMSLKVRFYEKKISEDLKP